MARISLGTWTFVVGCYSSEPESLDDVIREAAAAGYQGIALGGFKPHGSVDLYPKRSNRRELMDRIRDAGLQVNSYAPDLIGCDFYTGTRRRLDAYFERFDRSLEFCADCGIPLLRVDTVTTTPYPTDFQYDRAWNAAIEVFRSDAEKARDAGIHIVWEFEPGRIFNKPSEIRGILDAVDRENFNVQYDTAHGQLCAVVGAHQYGTPEVLPGGQEELIELISGRIGDVHLIDTDNTMYRNTNSHKVQFGTGVIDFPSLVEAMRAAGYSNEWWTVDLGPQHGDVWELARGAYQYARRLLDSGGM